MQIGQASSARRAAERRSGGVPRANRLPSANATDVQNRTAGLTWYSVFFCLTIISLIATVVTDQKLYQGELTAKALWFRTAIIVELPLYVYLLFRNPRLRPTFKNPLTFAVVTVLATAVVATIAGVNWNRSIWGYYSRMGGVYQQAHLTLLYFYVLLLGEFSSRYTRALIRVLVWLGASASAYGIGAAVYTKLVNHGPFFHDRLVSFYGNPVFFAAFVILPLALTLFECLGTTTAHARLLYSVLFIVQLAGLVLSATRGAFFGLIIGALLALCLSALVFDFWKAALRIVVGAGLVIAAVMFVVQSLPVTTAAHRLLDLDGEGRLIEWRVAWHGFLERPVLGFGPENFYVVANKYFDAELYKYVGSEAKFDKPHNNLLELLVTTGVCGFLAYVAMLAFTVAAIRRAMRQDIISKAQGIVLLGGLAAYHIQNCFAFDTPAASIAFCLFTAVAGSLSLPSQSQHDVDRERLSPRPFSPAVRVFLCFIVAGIACSINLSTFETLRDLYFGYAIGSQNAGAAKMYFDRAASTRFLVDRSTVAISYLEFAKRLLDEQPPSELTTSAIDAADGLLSKCTATNSNDAYLWLNLANASYLKTSFNHLAPDRKGYAALEKAITLAPQWPVPRYFLARYYSADKRGSEALALLSDIVQKAPGDPTFHWELSQAYANLDKNDLAIQEANQAITLGYRPRLRQLLWMINYYLDKHDYDMAAELYKRAVSLQPTNFRLYESLAAAYAKSGAWIRAREAAHMALQLNHTAQEERAVKAFIDSLPY